MISWSDDGIGHPLLVNMQDTKMVSWGIYLGRDLETPDDYVLVDIKGAGNVKRIPVHHVSWMYHSLYHGFLKAWKNYKQYIEEQKEKAIPFEDAIWLATIEDHVHNMTYPLQHTGRNRVVNDGTQLTYLGCF